MRHRRLLFVVLPLLPLALAAEGCAPARQVSRPESPDAALRPPAAEETVRIFQRTVPPAAPPAAPFSEAEADAALGRWLTLFEIDLTTVAEGEETPPPEETLPSNE